MTKDELDTFKWEKDPLILPYKDEIPGKVKMGTKRLDMKDWIKIDKTYMSVMQLKQQLIENEKENIFVSAPDNSTTDAKWELFDEVVNYLPERFPGLFFMAEKYLLNRATGEKVSVLRDGEEGGGGEDPLIRLARLTQDDWCVCEWSEEMQAYKVTAGAVTFPVRWSLRDKFTKPISLVHTPVKPFGDHLVKNVCSLLKAMKPSSPIWRSNWAMFNDLEGHYDLYTPTVLEERNEVNVPLKYEGKDTTGIKLTFRVECQTLRKLPKTGAIIFGIRTYQRYMKDFESFPIEDSLDLLHTIENLQGDFYVYRGTEFWKDAACKYLREIIGERKSADNQLILSAAIVALSLACIGFISYRKNVLG